MFNKEKELTKYLDVLDIEVDELQSKRNELVTRKRELHNHWANETNTPFPVDVQLLRDDIDLIDKALGIMALLDKRKAYIANLNIPENEANAKQIVEAILKTDQSYKKKILDKWQEAVDSLPEAPKIITSINDLARAMLQKDPQERITPQKAKEALLNIQLQNG